MRIFLNVMAAVVAALAALPAVAQPYPNKPIRIIVPHPPGGATDAVSRGLSVFLSQSLGQPVIVDNRPGASGIIGAEACAKSPADGYTFCLTNNDVLTLNPAIYNKLPYDAQKDLVPTVYIGEIAGIMLGTPGVAANTVRELVELGKKKPDSIRWATFGPGSVVHVYADWLKNSTGAGFLAVHYKGAGPAVTAVLGGEVDATLFGIGPAVSNIKAGKLKALAILGARRSPLLPEVPTLLEQGFQFYISTWIGIFAPAGTPREAVMRMNAEVNRALKDPQFKETILDRQTVEAAGGSPEDFVAMIRKDRADVERIVKISGVKLDFQ
ncbi:MAG: tripartite tricarboxylate transporter substrate binding protein [Candidatus Parcubacteria bacterium]|nr:tripartite tricarboxylate transporter substrate binding protein [Burkholderiales bacterium]